MAKGNLFLGQARGKVGSVVFARAFGEQITRTRPTSVANPKTIGQNTQRAILATIAKSAAAMTSLVDHSFANVTYGAESVRHFRKINMGLLRNLYLNTQNGANLSAKGGNFVPNPLKISEGSLPSFYTVVNSDDVAFHMSATSTLPTTEDVTVADFLDTYPALQGGDQITLVKIVKINGGTLIDGDALFSLSLDRIVFAPNAFSDPNAVIIENGVGVIKDTFLDLSKTTNPLCLSVNTEGGLGFTSEGDVYYTALILSRKVNNVWQRSAQYLEQVDFDDHTNNDAAIASYGATSSLSEDTEYLNQAEEGDAASGTRGAYMNATVKFGSDPAESEYVNAGESSSGAYEGASGTIAVIGGQAYAPEGLRVVTVELDRPDGSYAAHGEKSVNYQVAVTSATAGNWKLVALFSDGTRAQFTITLAVQG